MKHKITVFEMILLVVGLTVTILGFYLINQTYHQVNTEISWLMVVAIFSWLTLLVSFIISSTNVDMDEELTQVIKENAKETSLLKKLVKNQSEEVSLMRKQLEKKSK